MVQQVCDKFSLPCRCSRLAKINALRPLGSCGSNACNDALNVSSPTDLRLAVAVVCLECVVAVVCLECVVEVCRMCHGLSGLLSVLPQKSVH